VIIDKHGALHDDTGQYAAQGASTATYDLAAPSTVTRKTTDWSDPADVEHLRKLLRVAAGASRSLGANVGGTDWAQDMESSVSEEIVKASTAKDGSNRVREITPAWVRTVARNIQSNALEAVRQGRSPDNYMRVNKRTVRAWSALAARRRQFHIEHGRDMTPAEVDEVATEIRASFPPSQRPPVGFQNSHVSGKVTRGVDEGVEDNGKGMFADYEASAEAVAISKSTSRDADDVIDSFDPGAKRGKWLTTAKVKNIDFSAEETLTEPEARRMRQEVGDTNEDVMRMVDDWWDYGERGQRAAVIIENVFGAGTPSQQRTIVDVLEEHSGMAHSLFNAAVTDATIRRNR